MGKILITGVAGMIGSHLLDELLEENHQVIGLDNLSFGKINNVEENLKNSNFEFHNEDISNLKALEELSSGVDVIFHMAAVKKIGENHPALPTLMVNAVGTENVFKAALKNKCKVVYASTSDVYGVSEELPFREDGHLVLGPGNVKRWSYAVAKLFGEQVAFSYYKDFKVPTAVVRYFGGFSPRASFTWSGGHVPIFIDAILKDQEVVIHGDGSQTRSMSHVNDLVNGTILAMKKEAALGEIINLGNNEEMSVLEAAKLIHKLADTGKNLKLKLIPHKEIFGEYREIKRRIPCLEKAAKILGYKPKWNLEEAFRATILAKKKELGLES